MLTLLAEFVEQLGVYFRYNCASFTDSTFDWAMVALSPIAVVAVCVVVFLAVYERTLPHAGLALCLAVATFMHGVFGLAQQSLPQARRGCVRATPDRPSEAAAALVCIATWWVLFAAWRLRQTPPVLDLRLVWISPFVVAGVAARVQLGLDEHMEAFMGALLGAGAALAVFLVLLYMREDMERFLMAPPASVRRYPWTRR